MRKARLMMLCLPALLATALQAAAAPAPGQTTVIGPFTGHGAKLHPANVTPVHIAYYGTDLGWSYTHAGKIQFLFGDTWSTPEGAPIEASTGSTYDDGFGTLELEQWADGARIAPDNIPLLRLGQNPGTGEMAAFNPGFALEALKTPLGGFSNGSREFALFITGKPAGCRADADCPQGLSCETRLGYLGTPYEEPEGLTFPCADGQPGCSAETMGAQRGKAGTASGFCVDRGSSMWDDTGFGHIGAVAMRHFAGIRSESDARIYSDTQPWLTSRFINVALRKGRIGSQEKVLLLGRPWFVGANALGRTLSLYFAYVDLPVGAALAWRPKYYAGTDARGAPRFSDRERDAVALDLDSSRPGVQAAERHDIVNQASVSWIEPLGKWVMFYGGGLVKSPIAVLAPKCGALQIFARAQCEQVALGNGAMRMRTADFPWGPWSPPADLIVGGDADRRPTADQYGPGGVLYHPACAREGCASGTQRAGQAGDYGWLYGANIIEEWTTRAAGGVDVIWNASTWNPYRVILLRTHIDP